MLSRLKSVMRKVSSGGSYYDDCDEPPDYYDIIKYFKNKDNVLDVGCGTGWIGRHLKHVTGIDNSPEAVKRAAKYEKTVLQDLTKKLKFKKEYFDGIIAKDVIEHLKKPVFLLKELNRVLKKKGIIFVSVPTKHRRFYQDKTHVKPYTKKILINELTEAGFVIGEIKYTSTATGSGFVTKLLRRKRKPLPFQLLANMDIGYRRIDCIAIKK